ncbi:DUF4269 domain-containing protein [Paenibacillus glufosinatiresistens]|uniref:DUF4269 domain-containing protein n=1 Tax=Paenibacillus glufosinatiresistens TaxID=3070657 RepID=UPI00286E21BA|nr:DUF4269 domain-containing protein [Paenibacillus sp. YX.27]
MDTTDGRQGGNDRSELERWKEPWWLPGASAQQRSAWNALEDCGLWGVLDQWDPLLAGTVPIGLQLPGSDLDILCEVPEREMAELREVLTRRFGGLPGFGVSVRRVRGIPRLVARFDAGGWPVEVFGQPVPVRCQNGFRHMAAEQRVLELRGEAFREEVMKLRRDGYKTEPAFARMLELAGRELSGSGK